MYRWLKQVHSSCLQVCGKKCKCKGNMTRARSQKKILAWLGLSDPEIDQLIAGARLFDRNGRALEQQHKAAHRRRRKRDDEGEGQPQQKRKKK
jgi:hypothetical protein